MMTMGRVFSALVWIKQGNVFGGVWCDARGRKLLASTQEIYE